MPHLLIKVSGEGDGVYLQIVLAEIIHLYAQPRQHVAEIETQVAVGFAAIVKHGQHGVGGLTMVERIGNRTAGLRHGEGQHGGCLLYTSDAADD